jgi:replicative DNA helicase
MAFTDYRSECRVLSAMVHSESACLEAITQLDMDYFAHDLTRDMFSLILSIYSGGIYPSYAVFLKEAMNYGFISKDNPNKFKEINDVVGEYIDDQEIQYWIDEIISNAKARECSSVLKKYQAYLEDLGKRDIDNTLADCIGDLAKINIFRSKETFETGDQIAKFLTKIMAEKERKFREKMSLGEVILEGLSTGFNKLDELTLGLKQGDLIILAAETGVGKTALGLQTAKTIGIDQNISTLYINTEMSREQIYQRLWSNVSNVPLYDIKRGNYDGPSGNDRPKVNAAIQKIAKSNFIHRFCPGLTPSQCIMLGRQAKVQKHIQVMVIDYIGRMDKIDKNLNEWQVLEQIAKTNKILAQELQIPIMVLAQLNENGSLQGAKRIKNECDMLLKLYPIPNNEKEDYSKYANANFRLYLDKNRDGENDKNIALHYDKQVQRIESARLIESDHWDDISRKGGQRR